MSFIKKSSVDWNAYASGYDLMAENNPAYQNLRSLLSCEIDTWDIPSTGVIVDFGGGTGNFSVDIATRFSHAKVIHIDSSAEMNQLALNKSLSRGCHNFSIREQSVEDCSFPDNTLAAIVCVHALYTFPNPREVLTRFAQWLQPGGYLFACDLGRPMDVSDWRYYLFKECYNQIGLIRTLGMFWRGRVVASSNREIRIQQENGRYWLHTRREFEEAIKSAGFEIKRSQECYRGYSDLVVAVKTGNVSGSTAAMSCPIET